MINKIKTWWQSNRPVLTTQKKIDDLVIGCMLQLDKQNELSTWAAINPVISSLNELEKNTWDVERVRIMKKWLKDNFEVMK